mgnify:CR=1 FL=1
MDHVLNSLRPYLEVELDMVTEEWRSGEYGKLSECPSYDSLKTLVGAANIIRKYLGIGTLKIKNMVEEMS